MSDDVPDDPASAACRVYGAILALDESLRGSSGGMSRDMEAALTGLIRGWRAAARGIPGGCDRLRACLAEAGAILTPDREFFGGDELARLRDAAIEDHRAGRTEPLTSP